jgi:serine/threonine-protein kinase RsbW
MAAETTVKLVIPSEVRLVDLVHAASEKMAELAGFQEEDALNVGLAVREAVINAIVHGNRKDSSRKVDVTLVAGRDGVKATVRDRGEGFDVAATPDPRDTANLLKTSGRGLLLIRAFVDDVAFRYRRGQGMEITLVKKIRPEERAASG